MAATLGAQPCTSQECRLIDDNVAQNLSGQATAGSTVLLQGSVQMYADRLRLRGNRGAVVVGAFGSAVVVVVGSAWADADGAPTVSTRPPNSDGAMLSTCTVPLATASLIATSTRARAWHWTMGPTGRTAGTPRSEGEVVRQWHSTTTA